MWWRILCAPKAPTVDELYAHAPFDVNISYEGGGNVLWYANQWRFVSMLPPLLRLGFNASHVDLQGHTFLYHASTMYTYDHTHHSRWAKLLIDHGCPCPRPDMVLWITSRDSMQLLAAYAGRSMARKQAARLAATSVIAAAKWSLGRDLARILGRLVWRTRRERCGAWEPHEDYHE